MKKVLFYLLLGIFCFSTLDVYALDICASSSSFCCEIGVLKAFKILAFVIKSIQILVPVILLIVAFYSAGRALVADIKDVKQIIRSLVVKFIVAIFIYFAPIILLGSSNLFDGMEKTKSDFNICTSCLRNSDNCDVYIKLVTK